MKEKKKIKVYSTPNCPYCAMTKNFLREKGIDFEDIDVSKDHETAKRIVEKSGHMGVPQIEINDKIIIGFDREAIERELQNM